jgi:hypothetical protein
MKTYTIVPILTLLCGCMSIQEKNVALLRAARTGDTATVKRMVDRHADITTKDTYGDTALHLALKNKHTDTAELLVSRGANVNAKGALEDTPLHVSIYESEAGMATLLRQKGADDTLLNRYGLNPAEMQGLPEIESKIVETAQLLSPGGEWTDRSKARAMYDSLRARQDKYLINSLVLQIIRPLTLQELFQEMRGGRKTRLKVLILAVKLGIHGSEEKLVSVLMVYGDKSMAEDFLNSGSDILADGGRSWAAAHRYRITTGPGSHRASWGSF